VIVEGFNKFVRDNLIRFILYFGITLATDRFDARIEVLIELVVLISNYTEAVLKFRKLNSQTQQRGAFVRGRSLSPYRLGINPL
jgi:hypothetical protein